jgi:outer membrane protein OmpA-like peptidoglycan-associated protein
MKSLLTTLILLPILLSAKDTGYQMPTNAAKKILTPEEIARRWDQAETRSLKEPPTEKRTATITPEHLARLKAAGADRGIAVVPDNQGQNQCSVSVNPDSSISFPNILFKINSTALADEASRQQVENIAQALRTQGGKTFVLEGHTCDLGADGHNLTLSERRASAIFALLTTRGVPPAQILPLGFGEAKPELSNTSDTNRELNRRVVLSIRQ